MTSPSPDVRVLEIREHASRIAELCDDITADGGTPPVPLPAPTDVAGTLARTSPI